MKKKTKIIILIILSFLTAVALWIAANFKKISDLDIFDIEDDQIKRYEEPLMKALKTVYRLIWGIPTGTGKAQNRVQQVLWK